METGWDHVLLQMYVLINYYLMAYLKSHIYHVTIECLSHRQRLQAN